MVDEIEEVIDLGFSSIFFGDDTFSGDPRRAVAICEEIRRRGSGDFVVRVFEAVGASRPVNLDRKGKIVVLDALWGLPEEGAGTDPQLRELQDKLKDEITAS